MSMGEEIQGLDREGRNLDMGCGATAQIGLLHWSDTIALLTIQETAGYSATCFLDRSGLIALIADAAIALARVDGRLS